MSETQWRDQVNAWDKAYRRKRTVIVLVVLFLIAGCVAGHFLYPKIEKLYRQAQAYDEAFACLETGQYGEAADAFWRAGDFLDAEEYCGRLNYQRAQAYLDCGRVTYAAITFGKAGDYLDARRQAFALWERFADRTVLCASESDVVGWIYPNGTAETRYRETDGDYINPGYIGDWTDLVSLSVGAHITVGTFENGSVRYTTNMLGDGSFRTVVTDWEDMILAYYNADHVIGLKSDGTVCVECFDRKNNCALAEEAARWTDIIDLCGARPLVGLKADGTLVTAACQTDTDADIDSVYDTGVEELKTLEQVVAVRTQLSGYRIVALLADGTTVAVGQSSDSATPFDAIVSPWDTYSVWFPEDLEAMEEPPRERALIAASFPDLSAQYYQEAVALAAEGKLQQAAIAFGKAGSYEDAHARSMELWAQLTVRPTIAVRGSVVAALKKDGTVALSDPGDTLGKKPSNLNKNFAVLRFCNKDLLGITQEGKVLVIGKKNGTLPAAENVVDAVYAKNYGIVMLRKDGTLVSKENSFPTWHDVISIVSYNGDIVALLADGTVRGAFTDENEVYIVSLDGGFLAESEGGTISAAYAGETQSSLKARMLAAANKLGVYALTPEGTLQADTEAAPQDLSQWTDLASITAAGEFLYGVKKDGTVLVYGKEKLEGDDFGYDAEKWTGIVSVAAADKGVVGLKDNGKLVFVGAKGLKNLSKLQKEVKKMSGLMVPRQTTEQ